MPRKEETENSGLRQLLLLDHRGTIPTAELTWFRERGWSVLGASGLEAALGLLDQTGPAAVLIRPLTLATEGAEWQALLPRLSPHQPLPWLVQPWEDVPAERVAEFLGEHDALADFSLADVPLEELDTRLRNLVRMERMLDRKRRHTADLEDQLITDHKTGLHNDRHFRMRLEQEFERTRRHGHPLALLLLDIDDFKQINDLVSYRFGDTVLHSLARVIRRSTRSIDIPARIGGDEFAIILPNTTLGEGVAIANRIRDAAAGTVLEEDGHQVEIHVSIGVATYDGPGPKEWAELFLLANEALKQAKRQGKSRIQFADPRVGGATTEDPDAAVRITAPSQATEN